MLSEGHDDAFPHQGRWLSFSSGARCHAPLPTSPKNRSGSSKEPSMSDDDRGRGWGGDGWGRNEGKGKTTAQAQSSRRWENAPRCHDSTNVIDPTGTTLIADIGGLDQRGGLGTFLVLDLLRLGGKVGPNSKHQVLKFPDTVALTTRLATVRWDPRNSAPPFRWDPRNKYCRNLKNVWMKPLVKRPCPARHWLAPRRYIHASSLAGGGQRWTEICLRSVVSSVC
jgi:hypothetical protein